MRYALTAFTLLLALPVLALLWLTVASWLRMPTPWMAAVVAADLWVLMVLCQLPRGLPRALLTLGLTALAWGLALWLVAAGAIGPSFGLAPWDAALRLGDVLALELSRPYLTAAAWPWWALGGALAVASGWLGGPSARRRPVP
jgi:hypothetical protein